MNLLFHIFGYIGSFMLIITFFPQVYKTIKTKDVDGLSKHFLLLNLIVCICWTVYGVGFLLDNDILNAITILASNVSIFFCTITLLYYVYKYEE